MTVLFSLTNVFQLALMQNLVSNKVLSEHETLEFAKFSLISDNQKMVQRLPIKVDFKKKLARILFNLKDD